MPNPSPTLVQALAVCAELTNTDFSPAAARVLASDLAEYPEHQVLGALQRCRRELRGKLTIADIMLRLDDGRPGPEEAWAMMPKDEAASCVWTDEMCEAGAAAATLINTGELVQARMTFIEKYRSLMQLARDAKKPVRWWFSPGTDKDGRELALLDAAEKGRLKVEDVRHLLPYHREDMTLNARLLALADRSVKLLS